MKPISSLRFQIILDYRYSASAKAVIINWWVHRSFSVITTSNWLINYLPWWHSIHSKLSWPLLLFNLFIDFRTHLIWIIDSIHIVIVIHISILWDCLLLHTIIIQQLTNMFLFKKLSYTKSTLVILFRLLLLISLYPDLLNWLWWSINLRVDLVGLKRKFISSCSCFCMFLFHLNFEFYKLFFKFRVDVAWAKERSTG